MPNHDIPVDALDDPAGTTRRQLLGRAGALAGLLALPGGLLTACGSGAGAGRAADLTHLKWGVPGGVETISPNIFTAVGVTIAHMGLEALLQLNARGEIEPWLAERFVNRDNREFVLTLREGVKWSDGTPLTVEDVLFQFEYNLREKAQPIYGYYPAFGVTDVEQTGPREITVRATRPNTRIPATVLASQASWLVQPTFLRRYGYDKMGSPAALPIGTGPYVFEQFVPQSSITLRRNEHYWAWDRLKLVPETIEVTIFEESSTRVLAARTGEISGSHVVTPDELPQYRALPGYSTYSVPDLTTWFFALNNTVAPFDDLHARRAMAYALDRSGIAEAVWGGYATPATAFAPPQVWRGLLPDDEVRALYASIPSYEFDLTRAADELAQSRTPNGFTLSVLTSEAQSDMAKVAQIYARDLAKIGITLKVKPVSENQYFEPLFNNNFNDPNYIISIGITSMDALDPIPALDDYYSSRNVREGLTNFSHYVDTRFDALLERQATTTDPHVRGKAMAEIIRIASEASPYVSIVWPEVCAATGPGIEYAGFNPFIFLNGNPWPAGLHRAADA
jgi:peptide/nickel transport system substrate-binding protein